MMGRVGVRVHRFLLALASVVVVACSTFLHPLHARAAPTVTNCNDSGTGSLRAAIAAAVNGDTITFAIDCSGLPIPPTSTLTIDKSITIDGTGHNVVVDGNDTVRVFTVTGGTVTLNALTIRLGNAGNCGATCGGGIYTDFGVTLTVTNSTFTRNSSPSGDGGAIFNRGLLTVTNSTFSGNSARDRGGAIFLAGGIVTLTNTLLAANTASSGANCAGPISDGGHNLEFNPTNSCPFSAANHDVFTDPRLGPIGQIGNPLPFVALLPGSGAIDAGAPVGGMVPATDERGLPRVSAPDIGAFESQGFALAVTSGGTESTLPGAAFPQPLTVTVTSSHGEQVSGGVVTFTVNPVNGAGAALSADTATINSGGTASVTAMANGTAGPYTVTASASGAATSATFSLTNTPVLSGISPAVGGTAGGGQVTLSGMGFSTVGNTQVLVGGSALPVGSILSISGTQIAYIAPAHMAGDVTVTVSVGGAMSAGQTYTYGVVSPLPAPQVSGPAPGGPLAPLPPTRPPGLVQGSVPAPLPPRRP